MFQIRSKKQTEEFTLIINCFAFVMYLVLFHFILLDPKILTKMKDIQA